MINKINKLVEVSASILSADFKHLDREIKSVIKYGVNYLHFDVMDGQFVKNISFGIPVLESLKKGNYPIVFDVHLMIINPLQYIERFIKAGANIVTIHYEAISKEDIQKISKLVHSYNAKFGLSIKPETSVSSIKDYLKFLDLVLVMSVEPGFGGQKFINESANKIKELDDLRKENKYTYLIEVDGGINEETSKICISSGVDILVAGSYIFKSKNKKRVIERMR